MNVLYDLCAWLVIGLGDSLIKGAFLDCGLCCGCLWGFLWLDIKGIGLACLVLTRLVIVRFRALWGLPCLCSCVGCGCLVLDRHTYIPRGVYGRLPERGGVPSPLFPEKNPPSLLLRSPSHSPSTHHRTGVFDSPFTFSAICRNTRKMQ